MFILVQQLKILKREFQFNEEMMMQQFNQSDQFCKWNLLSCLKSQFFFLFICLIFINFCIVYFCFTTTRNNEIENCLRMQNNSPEKFHYFQSESYGVRMLKGVTQNQVINELSKYPLLVKYYKKNSNEIQNRIIDTLMREPSTSDCPGFIYGFKDYNEHKLNPYSDKYEIKMGRTKRQVPQDRIYEWQNQDGHQYVELFTIRSEHNNKLQSLVHLFFAYARKVKYINGKKRIEWFTFEEKALNAAVTAMINELMEKVHELGKKNETEISSISFDLKGFCQSVLKDILEIDFLRKRLIILGPKSSGKSVLKSMLNGEKLKCIKKINSDNYCFISQQVGLDIQIPKTIDLVQNIVQLNNQTQDNLDLSSSKDQLIQKLKISFKLWSKINCVQQQSICCLVITQSDLLSSQMIGLKNGLQNVLKYIKFGYLQSKELPENQNKGVQNLKLFILISKIDVSHKYTEQKVKKYILSNKDCLSSDQLSIILGSSIQFSYSPEKQGNYIYDIQNLKSMLQSHQGQEAKKVSFEYNNPILLNICEEIIHFSYEDVSYLFQDNLKAEIKKITKQFEDSESLYEFNEDSLEITVKRSLNLMKLVEKKLQFIQCIGNIVDKLKKSRKQQQILVDLKRLFSLLAFQPKDQVLGQLVIFCQCIMKSSSNNYLNLQQEQSSEKGNEKLKYLSPVYLANTLIFTRLKDSISNVKEQARQQMNSIIENEIKNSFSKVLKALYQSFDERNIESKLSFDETYNILFKLMNISETIEQKRVQNKVKIDDIPNDILEQEIVQKSFDQLIGISGGKNSRYYDQLNNLVLLINFIYDLSRNHGVRISSIVSRIKEAIFVATKQKKVVLMINDNINHITHDEFADRNRNLIVNKNRKPAVNKINNNIGTNNTFVNGDVKIILNKKDQKKNELLLNYINSQKKVEQIQNLNSHSVQNNRQEFSYDSFSSSSQKNTYDLRSCSRKKQDFSMEWRKVSIKQTKVSQQSKHDSWELPEDEQDYHEIKNGAKHQSGQDQFLSIPDDNDFEDMKYQMETMAMEINQKGQQNQIKINPTADETIMMQSDNNESYTKFIRQLNSSITSFKQKSNLTSLQDLYTQFLFNIQQQKRYEAIIFNYTDKSFVFDLPTIRFHNAFVIIYAKKIKIQQIGCEIDFKIHYKNRKPNKINLILMAESYEGLAKLKIPDNKYGKVLAVQVTNIHERRFKVHDGYYTKNKRNEAKLENLKLKDLIEAFCKASI